LNNSILYTRDVNTGLHSGVALRSGFFEIALLDTFGFTGLKNNLSFYNPPPSGITYGSGPKTFSIETGFGFVTVNLENANPEEDVNGIIFTFSESSFDPNLEIDDFGGTSNPNISVVSARNLDNLDITTEANKTYYYSVALYDTIGFNDLNYSPIYTVSTQGISNVPPEVPSGLVLTPFISQGNTISYVGISADWNNVPTNATYSVEIAESGSSIYKSCPVVNSDYTFENLKENQEYIIRVQAVSEIALKSDYTSGFAKTDFASGASALTPVGGIILHPKISSFSLDYFYKTCDGSSLNTGDYPTLFNKIGYSFGGVGTGFSIPSGQYNNEIDFIIRIK
jgi:hypothetical protein